MLVVGEGGYCMRILQPGTGLIATDIMLQGGDCPACYQTDRAKQQQAQGLSCSGCRREGLLLSGSGLCRNCSNKLKAEADQRAAIEEYTAAKAKQTAKAKEYPVLRL